MVAWPCFLLLCIYVTLALLFALCTIVAAAQALSAMWVSASAATPESISLAATFAVKLCFWIPHAIFLSLCNILMGASIWRMVLSGFTISVWWFNYHFQENYCKAISPALTIILAWECSWFHLAILTYGEAMKPTFGKKGKNEITDGERYRDAGR